MNIMNSCSEIDFDEFLRVEMRVGTIIRARLNEKAKKPAYLLEVDFGENIGIKGTSAQITKEHEMHDLIGTQVVAVMNFPSKRIAGFKSEVLVLASVEENGKTVLIKPAKLVQNGSRIY